MAIDSTNQRLVNVTNSTEAATTSFEDLPDDVVGIIAGNILKGSISNLSVLAVISRRWRVILNLPDVAKTVFHQACLPLPSQLSESWQRDYRLSMGNCFFSQPPTPPTAQLISYSSDIRVWTNGFIAWIDDKGFIHYEGSTFSVCLFSDPHNIRNCSTKVPISYLQVIQNKIVCGLQTGLLVVYSLETLELLFSFNNHSSAVMDIFEYQDGFVSVCSSKVMRTNFKHGQSVCVWNIPPEILQQTYILQFLFHSLVFTFPETKEFGLFQMHFPQAGLRMIKPPTEECTSLVGWGKKLAFIDNSSLWCYPIPFNPQNPSLQIEWSTPNLSHSPCVFFKGDMACLIFIQEPEENEENEEIEEIEEIELSDVEDDTKSLLLLIDLKNGSSIEFCDQGSIAVDEDDNYLFTIYQNKLIYLLNGSHSACIVEFPVVEEVEFPNNT